MHNEVFLNEHDIIEVRVVGDQTFETVAQMGTQIAGLVDNLMQAGKAVLILDDLRQMKKVTPEGRKEVIDLAKKLHYERLAMVGESGLLRVGSNLMFQAIGKGEKLKYFENYDAASEWLQDYRLHLEA